MQRGYGKFVDSNGNPVSGATVTVLSPGTSTKVTLYDPNGGTTPTGTITNPVVTGSDGNWVFAIPDGSYDVLFQGGDMADNLVPRVNFIDGSTMVLTGGSSITSVSLSLPASEFTVSGSPILTGAGAFAAAWKSQSAAYVFAAPAGGPGTPAFLALSASHIPSLDASKITTGILGTARGGNGAGFSAAQYINGPVRLIARVAATVNISVSAPGASIDGVALSANDRVLLTNQGTPAQNGLWVWNSAIAAMTRPEDYQAASTTQAFWGLQIRVSEGTAKAGSLWYMTTTGAITIDTTGVAFSQLYSNNTGLSSNMVMTTDSNGRLTGTTNFGFDGAKLSFINTYINMAPYALANAVGDFNFDATQLRFSAGVGVGTATKTTIPGVLWTQVSNPAAINTTGVSLIPSGNGVGTLTIQANTLKVGSIITIKVQGICAALAITTHNYTFSLNGVTKLTLAGASALAANSLPMEVEIQATVTSVGAGGTMNVVGKFINQGATSAMLVNMTSANGVAINTTIANLLDLVTTWTTIAGSLTVLSSKITLEN